VVIFRRQTGPASEQFWNTLVQTLMWGETKHMFINLSKESGTKSDYKGM